MQPVITFIGPGNMSHCLIGGLINDQYPASQLWVSGPDQAKLQHLKQQFSIQTSISNVDAVSHADIVVLAVKPQVMQEVALEIAPIIAGKKPLIVSIAAGITVELMQRWLGGKYAVVRCMPNTPALVGTGATAMYASSQVTDQQQQQAESLMRSVGLAVWVDVEEKMNAVTALSGSGPAYFFLVMEVLQKAGVALGLSDNEAKLLTLQTALGSAKMAMESDQDAASLRRAVTSPGGTTEQAVEVLSSGNIEQTFFDALQAAAARAKALSDQLNENNL